jgi:hypothetical protein
VQRLIEYIKGRPKRFIVLVTMIVFIGASADSCDSEPTTADKTAEARSKAVDKIRENQPVQAMPYSPTLDTINRWAKLWGQKGQVSYVYMQKADGTYAGYYVLSGLPVSYCVGGSPPYDYHDIPGDDDDVEEQVPAPGLDGAYYGGCNANRYYGFDAVTGQYIEYTDGYVLTAVLSNQPLPDSAGVRPYVSSAQQAQQAAQQGKVFDPDKQAASGE